MMKPRLVKFSNGKFGIQVARWPVAKFLDLASDSYSWSARNYFFPSCAGEEERVRRLFAARYVTWKPVE